MEERMIPYILAAYNSTDAQAWENWKIAVANFYQGGTNLAFWIVIIGLIAVPIITVYTIRRIWFPPSPTTRDNDMVPYDRDRTQNVYCERCNRTLIRSGLVVASHTIMSGRAICNRCLDYERAIRRDMEMPREIPRVESDNMNQATAHITSPQKPVHEKKKRILKLD